MSNVTAPALPARPKVLLCDAGNTLVFFDAGAAAVVLQAHGLSLDAARIDGAQRAAGIRYQRLLREQSGSHEDGWRTYVATLLEEAGAPPPLDRLVDRLREAHDAFNLWRQVPHGLVHALDRLGDEAPPTRIGVVSNSEGRLVDLFARVGIAPYLEVIVDSALEGVCKPDPEIFRRALDRMEVEAHDALYVGDLPDIDVVGARRAGIDAVLVDPFGFHPTFVDAPRVRSLVELVEYWLGGSDARAVSAP